MKILSRQKRSFRKWIYQYLTKACFISLGLIIGHATFSQNLSDKARFSVDYIQGCAPLTVTLTDLAAVVDNGAPILVHFNRNPADRENNGGITNIMNTGGTVDTTYTTPGTYLIGQVNGNIADPTDRYDFIEVVVVESVAPTYTISTCTNNNIEINLDFSGDTYDGYSIDFGDGQSTNITKSDPATVNHAYASQNNYTVTVTGQLTNGFSATCGMATTPITTIQNLPIPTITELALESQTSVNFTYSALSNNISYELEVDDGSGYRSIAQLSPANNPNSFILDDPSLDFEQNVYLFRIMATEACGSSSGFSNEIPSITLLSSAAYAGNQIEITFDWSTSAADLTELFLLRNGNIDGSSTNPTGQQIIAINSCLDPLTFQIEANFAGSISQSLIQTANLNGTLTPPTLGDPEIAFSAGELLVRWPLSTVTTSQYNIYRQDSDGNYVQIATSPIAQYVDSNLTANARQVCYRISYTDECGNESALSAEVCENLSNQILIPNAFTPNGDGVNDIFRAADGVYRNFEFMIYNRWGALVFASSSIANGWDGTTNGQLSPAGAYVYRIQYFDVSDRLTSVTGTFLLIR